MSIHFIATGGTFDKDYDTKTGEFVFLKTHLQEILESANCEHPFEVETLMMMDSLHMNMEDREKILKACQDSEHDQIIITHGTDTMAETAEVLADGLEGKTVVLTGAMRPYRFGFSDAVFNLGAALGFVQSLQPGVYVAMNGKLFNAKNVRKNRNEGRFEAINQ